MSNRLQVVLDESELADMREIARREGKTLSAWVRTTLRAAQKAEPQGDLASKLHATREGARHGFPTADIDTMLGEIESAHRAPLPE